MIFILANWKWLLGAAGCAALAFALMLAKMDASHWHKVVDQQALSIAVARQQAAEQAAANAKRLSDATATYASDLASRQPIIVRSIDTVRTYAQTDAGRAPCLAPVRASGVLQDRQALFPASTASTATSSPGALRTDPTGNTSGRVTE